MPRSSIIGTGWQGAWGTAGTQYLKPSPHIEGLGSWAGRMDDRMCFLAFQQTDVVFSEDHNTHWYVGHNEFQLMEKWRVYYNGYHPQMHLGFVVVGVGVPTNISGTLSIRFGDIDFGTAVVSVYIGTSLSWFADIPDSLATGEYKLRIYAASGDDNWNDLRFVGAHMSYLPTRL